MGTGSFEDRPHVEGTDPSQIVPREVAELNCVRHWRAFRITSAGVAGNSLRAVWALSSPIAGEREAGGRRRGAGGDQWGEGDGGGVIGGGRGQDDDEARDDERAADGERDARGDDAVLGGLPVRRRRGCVAVFGRAPAVDGRLVVRVRLGVEDAARGDGGEAQAAEHEADHPLRAAGGVLGAGGGWRRSGGRRRAGGGRGRGAGRRRGGRGRGRRRGRGGG